MELIVGEPDIYPQQWRCRNCGYAFNVPARETQSNQWSRHRNRYCTHPQAERK